MEVDLPEAFLLLFVLIFAAVLFSLGYMLAKSRQGRPSICMGLKLPCSSSIQPYPVTLGRDSRLDSGTREERKLMVAHHRKNNEGGKVVLPHGTLRKVCKRTGEVFTFFFRDTILSQWYICRFTVDGQNYNCTEQFMMYKKAGLFEDYRIAQAILLSCDPKEQKALGRKVKNFDPKVWDAYCKDIVRRGNMAKFSQNEQLKHVLLSTAGTTLVEASPYDCIWGIGLGAKNPLATDRTTWRGSNWLGEILTEVRDKLMHKQNAHYLVTLTT